MCCTFYIYVCVCFVHFIICLHFQLSGIFFDLLFLEDLTFYSCMKAIILMFIFSCMQMYFSFFLSFFFFFFFF